MNNFILLRLFDRIGEIDDSFLEEALTADIAGARATRLKRIGQGTAGVALVTGVAVYAYWKFRRNKVA